MRVRVAKPGIDRDRNARVRAAGQLDRRRFRQPPAGRRPGRERAWRCQRKCSHRVRLATDVPRNASRGSNDRIVVETVRGTNHSARRSGRIPCHANPRRDVIAIARPLVRSRHASDAERLGRKELPLVAHACPQTDSRVNLPHVFRKERQVAIVVGRARVAVALHVCEREAKRNRLDRRDRGWKRCTRRKSREDVAAAEVKRQRLIQPLDDADVGTDLEQMLAAAVAERVHELIADVVPRRWREALSAEARDARDLDRRTTFVFAVAGAVASGVERRYGLIAPGHQEARFVDELRRRDEIVRDGAHDVGRIEHRGAAPRHQPAERLDVLVQFAGAVDPDAQPLTAADVLIELAEPLRGTHLIWHVAGVEAEAGRPQDLCWCPERHLRLKRMGDVRLIVYRDEIVGVDLLALDRSKVEQPITPHRASERGAVLLLTEWRLLHSNRIAKEVEALEVVLRIQGVVAEEIVRAAARGVGPAPGHDVDDAA